MDLLNIFLFRVLIFIEVISSSILPSRKKRDLNSFNLTREAFDQKIMSEDNDETDNSEKNVILLKYTKEGVDQSLEKLAIPVAFSLREKRWSLFKKLRPDPMFFRYYSTVFGASTSAIQSILRSAIATIDSYDSSMNNQIYRSQDELDPLRNYIISDVFKIMGVDYHEYMAIAQFFMTSKYVMNFLNETVQKKGKNVGKMIKALLDIELKNDENPSINRFIFQKLLYSLILDLWSDKKNIIQGNFCLKGVENDVLLKKMMNLFTVQNRLIKTDKAPDYADPIVLDLENFMFDEAKSEFRLIESRENSVNIAKPLVILKKSTEECPILISEFSMQIKGKNYKPIAALEKTVDYSRKRSFFSPKFNSGPDKTWIRTSSIDAYKVDPKNMEKFQYSYILFEMED